MFHNNINHRTQKMLNLLNEANNLNFYQENGILPMIIQNQIMMQQLKLPVIQKF